MMEDSHLSNSRTKNWGDLKQAVRELRRQISCLSSRVPSSFSFRQLSPSVIRIYFLCSPSNGRETTLFFCDVDTNFSWELEGSPLVWHPAIDPNFQVLPSVGKFSKEEQLQWERKRLVTSGITSYEIHHESGRLIFPAGGSMFQCVDQGNHVVNLQPIQLETNCGGARLNCQICPNSSELVAFVSNSDVWVAHTESGNEQRLTWVHTNKNSLAADPLSAGIPSYVIQEEFCRFQGFWWQPVMTDDVFRILIEEVDESDVGIIKFPSFNGDGGLEEYRFPRAGTPNAKSDLKMVTFQLGDKGEFVDIQLLELRQPLGIMFPSAEYLTRAGWTPDGENVWVQLVDRLQQKLDLVLIPIQLFRPCRPIRRTNIIESSMSAPSICRHPAQILCSVFSQNWINVHDILHFLPTDESDMMRFIFATEESGYRHLYLYTVQLILSPNKTSNTDGVCRAAQIDKQQLTSGEWEVLDQWLWVDHKFGLVYFMGLRDSPLSSHLYVTSYIRPSSNIVRLTQSGYSHTVSMNKECTIFVTVYSNTQSMPACQVVALEPPSDLVHPVPMAFLVEPALPDQWYQPPELFSHVISSGDRLHGMIFRPHSYRHGQKYPTVLNIYGGPEVQLVTNTFKGLRQLRLHMLAALGYCVLTIDSRGSQNRGVNFESHIKGRLGTVELHDQVEVLQWVAETFGCIDLSRVAIHGWSYGGYLSLLGLAQYPHVFKVAIAGAPVTSWNLYDTGYTERYLGQPQTNQIGYKNGCVLSYINQFPDQENRLLIIHGMIDENVHFAHTSQLINALVRSGKPYQLQVYPNERHSLRHLDASEHYETVLLTFLRNCL
ncbi:dipeptidyl peptidase 9 [Daphnia magna]|uniref:dipeptidyl peptidase 9 n=1 Tax=Daphnia magna TaxID=35525 RepID=UPI001E1BB854|nr:dipeptidyl peptidase 9 [Daphnia magna]XP_045029709.1 dipeptidyl peptidase 9 [Daphnia magna]